MHPRQISKRVLRLVSRLRASLLPALLLFSIQAAAQQGPRLYIFDNGDIVGMDPGLFNFSADELRETDFVVTSYLIVHPRGTLMWEAGSVPDALLPADGGEYREGPIVVQRSLAGQLAEAGYAAADIDYFAMSHLHLDHNGNANAFAGSTWIVQQADRDMMFSGEQVQVMDASHFSALEQADTILLQDEDHDVFGDGSVRILSTPGHTPGHQVLLIELENYGPVMLAGDLYHFEEEIATGRTPTFEYDPAASARSRERIGKILEESGAQLWIGHDKLRHESLRFAPDYYE